METEEQPQAEPVDPVEEDQPLPPSDLGPDLGIDLVRVSRKPGQERFESKMEPKKMAVFKLPDVYFFPFAKQGLEKPWLDNKEKMDEYFNYGFTEESYKVYAQKVIKFADAHIQELADHEEFEKKMIDDDGRKEHGTLNFYMPHEFGGCGAPV